MSTVSWFYDFQLSSRLDVSHMFYYVFVVARTWRIRVIELWGRIQRIFWQRWCVQLFSSCNVVSEISNEFDSTVILICYYYPVVPIGMFQHVPWSLLNPPNSHWVTLVSSLFRPGKTFLKRMRALSSVRGDEHVRGALFSVFGLVRLCGTAFAVPKRPK